MNERIVLAGWFVLGVFLQANFSIRCRWKFGLTLFCAFMALVGLIPGKHESDYAPYVHALGVVAFFALAFLSAYMKDILPVVTDRTLLFYSLLFWFTLFSLPGDQDALQKVLMVLGLVPTLATVLIAFVDVRLGFAWRLVLYAWFLGIVATLGVCQYSAHWLAVFFSTDASTWPSPGACILGGMASMCLLGNLFYLFLLLPVPAKGQSFSDRMKDWHEFTHLLAERLDDVRGGRGYAALVFFGVGGLLLADLVERWITPSLLINGLLAAQCIGFVVMEPDAGHPVAAPVPSANRARRRQLARKRAA